MNMEKCKTTCWSLFNSHLITITAGITVAYPIQSKGFCILQRYIGGHQKASKCTPLKVLQLC